MQLKFDNYTLKLETDFRCLWIDFLPWISKDLYGQNQIMIRTPSVGYIYTPSPFFAGKSGCHIIIIDLVLIHIEFIIHAGYQEPK